jgi:hypothetical protein
MDNRKENYEKYVHEAINKIKSLNIDDLSRRDILWNIVVEAIKGCTDTPFRVGDDVVVDIARYRSVVVEVKDRKLRVYDYQRQSASKWYDDSEVMFTKDYHINKNTNT